jgi:hypothetical protein
MEGGQVGLLGVCGGLPQCLARLRQTGLAVVVGFSLFKILLQVTRPNVVVKGLVRRTQSYRGVVQYRDIVRAL